MRAIYNPFKTILILVGFLLPTCVVAQPPTISYVDGFPVANAPIDIVNAGDGSNRLFIVEQNGVIEVRNGTTLTQFANFGAGGAGIISTGGSEQGLLSMAFHPGYNRTTNRYFFIYYTDVSGNIAVTRYQTRADNPDTVEVGTATPIITIPHPGQQNHNGGKLNFGTDGYLYFATGDGGGGNDVPNNAQTGTVLLGKMLRIDIDNPSATYGNYSVPPGNPYIADPNVDDRIWAIGLRNPFRWSFDRLTGDMWIGDVGQGAQEEINFRPAGATGGVNYGWRCFEGYPSTPGVADCLPANYIPPVYDYPNPNPGASAVTGGYVYRGSEFPTFPGYYVAADVYSGEVFILWPNGSGGFDSAVQSTPVSFVVGFGEAEDGTLYAASQGTNTIYKVSGVGGGVIPVTLQNFSGLRNTGFNELKWKTVGEQGTAVFHVEFSRDGSSFQRTGVVPAERLATGAQYSFRHFADNKETFFYRLVMEDDNGQLRNSAVIRIAGSRDNRIRVFPTVVNTGMINLALDGSRLDNVRLINSNGVHVYNYRPSNASGSLALRMPALQSGVYVIEMATEGKMQRERIIIQ